MRRRGSQRPRAVSDYSSRAGPISSAIMTTSLEPTGSGSPAQPPHPWPVSHHPSAMAAPISAKKRAALAKPIAIGERDSFLAPVLITRAPGFGHTWTHSVHIVQCWSVTTSTWSTGTRMEQTAEHLPQSMHDSWRRTLVRPAMPIVPTIAPSGHAYRHQKRSTAIEPTTVAGNQSERKRRLDREVEQSPVGVVLGEPQ